MGIFTMKTRVEHRNLRSGWKKLSSLTGCAALAIAFAIASPGESSRGADARTSCANHRARIAGGPARGGFARALLANSYCRHLARHAHAS